MEHLKELGLDTSKASMCWTTFNGDTMLQVHDDYCYESASLHPIPTFNLQDILKLLPHCIKEDFFETYYLVIEKLSDTEEDWNIRYCLHGGCSGSKI